MIFLADLLGRFYRFDAVHRHGRFVQETPPRDIVVRKIRDLLLKFFLIHFPRSEKTFYFDCVHRIGSVAGNSFLFVED